MPIPAGVSEQTVQTGNGGAYVTVGDVTLSPGEVVDGARWDVEPIDGWDSPAAVEFESSSRVSSDGVRVGAGWYGARGMELRGTVRAFSWAEGTSARNRLVRGIPPKVLTPMVVSTPGEEPLMTMVRLDGQILFSREGVLSEWSVPLVAPDPRRYALSETAASTGLPQTTGGLTLPLTLPLSVNATVTAGRVTVTNTGDIDAPATLTILGPCPPCSITHIGSGRRLNIPEAIAAGRSLVLDTDARKALLDGTEARTVTGAWFNLDAGTNDIAFNAASYNSSARLTVAFRSAWR